METYSTDEDFNGRHNHQSRKNIPVALIYREGTKGEHAYRIHWNEFLTNYDWTDLKVRRTRK